MKKYNLIGEVSDIDYHDDVWDFCGPKSIKAFLAELKPGEKAEIEINSPGGLVLAGIEMANAIKNSSAHLIAHVTGMAASMASVIACACDEIIMEEASFMMIHDPWGAAEGNADELRKEAELLDQMKAVCMSFYRAKFDRTEEELAQLMSEETWYTGAECLANGLKCKVVASDVRAVARATSRHFGALPESAAALIKEQTMSEDVKAKLDALRAEARAEIVAAVDAPIEDNVKTEEKDESNMNEITIAIEDEKSEAVTAPNDEAHVTPQTVVEEVKEEVAKVETPATDWEARFKGASKKINELQSRISDLQKTADEANDKLAAAEKSLVARDAELDKAHAELNAAQGEIKAKCEALAIAEKDLADVRDNLSKATEQVEHLRQTRDILTGGVLTTPDEVNTYEAKIKRAKNAREREALRKAKARGEIE